MTIMLTMSVNLSLLAPSQYVNFDYNSMCEFNGQYFGANENGIFILDYNERDVNSSSSTTAIDTKFVVGPTDLGIRTDKRLRKCIVALESDGPINITVTTNEDEEGAVKSNQIPAFDDGQEHAVSIPFGRDIRGRYLTFLFENINGSHWSINNIEAFIEVLLRKP